MPVEQITTYKLMILYLLKQVRFPLTRAQLSDFMLKEYCTYFAFQQAVQELLSSHLMKESPVRNYVRFEITREGEEALEYFGSKIPEVIRKEMDEFLEQNKIRLRAEMGIVSSYQENENGEYQVSCEVREGKSVLIKLDLAVPTREQAEIVCERWHDSNEAVYAAVMQELLRD
ncbi:MAG: DUF4364 family protein [Lachnospiraceae bacterium]|nr:DUF4364 family protein [Lachnospiraceae bacterium]